MNYVIHYSLAFKVRRTFLKAMAFLGISFLPCGYFKVEPILTNVAQGNSRKSLSEAGAKMGNISRNQLVFMKTGIS